MSRYGCYLFPLSFFETIDPIAMASSALTSDNTSSSSSSLTAPTTTTTSIITTANKQTIVDKLFDFYNSDSQYGVETLVTQREHACQAAARALQSGADEDLIVAALLHDIGWKLAQSAPVDQEIGEGTKLVSEESLASQLGILAVCDVNTNSSLEQQRAQHDVIGATFLRMLGFREKIPHLIEGHVLAKRYFCLVDPTYRAGLSEGSQRTLEFQGGPMTREEADVFEKDPLFHECMTLRRWDEAAKVTGLEVPSLESYRDMIMRAIEHPRCLASQVNGSYERKGNTLIGLIPALV